MIKPLPLWKLAAVLLGFPIVHYFYSLVLLHRDLFTFGGLDFFLTFWLGSALIYLAKIFVVLRLITGSGWTPADIGYKLSRKGTGIMTVSYFAGALLLVLLLEMALGQVDLDPDRMASMRGLYPDTTTKRLVFILMAFAAGVSERWCSEKRNAVGVGLCHGATSTAGHEGAEIQEARAMRCGGLPYGLPTAMTRS